MYRDIALYLALLTLTHLLVSVSAPATIPDCNRRAPNPTPSVAYHLDDDGRRTCRHAPAPAGAPAQVRRLWP